MKPLEQGERKNLLLVTIDGVRADHLVSYGAPTASTPRLDHLAATGARFAQAISTSPSSLPSHASIMTGLYPFRHGLRTDRAHRLTGQAQTLASRLQSAGFHTAGVVSSALLALDTGLERGFDQMDEDLVAGSIVIDRTQRTTHAVDVVRRARAWLDQARDDKPYFLWLHFSDPLQPYLPPPGYAKRAAGNPYDGEISYVDEQIGVVLDLLRARGELSNTLVVVCGAHGQSLGEHNEDDHGVFVYDATTRVPMLISHPSLQQGLVVDKVSSIVDLAPTILGLLGQPVPAELDGVALGPVLTGEAHLPDRLVYSESIQPADELGWSDLRAVRSSDVRYIRAPRAEIYGLNQDPNELVDFSAEAAEQMQQLETELAALLAEGEVSERRPGAPAPFAIADGERADPKDAMPGYRERKRVIGMARRLDDDAESALLGLIESDPNDPELNLALGTMQLAKNQLAEALVPLRIAAEPQDASLVEVLALADVTHRLGMPESSQHIERARRIAANDPAPDLMQGDWALASKEYGQARTHYASALERDSGNLLALIGIGRACRGMGLLDEARQALERGLAVNPQVFALQFELGLVSEGQGRAADAAAHFERAASLAPGRRMAWRFAGSALLRVGRQDDALRAFQRAASLGDPTVLTHRNLTILLFQKRSYQEALGHAETVLKMESRDAQTGLLRAVCLDQLGRADEAKQALAEARAIDAGAVKAMIGHPVITSFLQKNP
jgi:arylsulfatase A-like enzyme/predicted Zn-dependent protease